VNQDNANQYLYDPDGQVCATKNLSSGQMTQYLYNASGRRVAKGTITSWSCDSTPNASGNPANGFTPTTQYILGPKGDQMTEISYNAGTPGWGNTTVSMPGAMATFLGGGGPPHFRLADWLGTTRVQTNSAGTAELTCQSLPFGDPQVPCTAPTAAEQFFTGKERDTESGNDYMFARYYDSATGRFLSPDWSSKAQPVPYAVLANPQSLNLYGYVLDNPLSGIDPDGHSCQVEGVDVASCVGLSNSDAVHVVQQGTELIGRVTEAKNDYSEIGMARKGLKIAQDSVDRDMRSSDYLSQLRIPLDQAFVDLETQTLQVALLKAGTTVKGWFTDPIEAWQDRALLPFAEHTLDQYQQVYNTYHTAYTEDVKGYAAAQRIMAPW
jgi:RHS repeat-associated protein